MEYSSILDVPNDAVPHTQVFWLLGLCPLIGILNNISFRKLDLFPSSGETLFSHMTKFLRPVFKIEDREACSFPWFSSVLAANVRTVGLAEIIQRSLPSRFVSNFYSLIILIVQEI
jgi:hypothetical protein